MRNCSLVVLIIKEDAAQAPALSSVPNEEVVVTPLAELLIILGVMLVANLHKNIHSIRQSYFSADGSFVINPVEKHFASNLLTCSNVFGQRATDCRITRKLNILDRLCMEDAHSAALTFA